MDLNEHLAINVMGYELRRPNKHPSNPSFYYDSGKLVCMDSDYDPRNNIQQAMDLLKDFTFRSMSWIEIFQVWEVQIGNNLAGSHFASDKNLAEAIVNAVAKATGFEE